MEKLHSLWAKLIDIVFWQTLISHFRWIDWITLGFLLLGFVLGMRKGLMRVLSQILEMILILTATLAFYQPVAFFLKAYITGVSEKTIAPIGFIITAICVWFVVAVIDKYMKLWLHSKISGSVRTAGGAVFGMLHFFIIWSFISQAVLLMPIGGVYKIYDAGKSAMGPYVKEFVPAIYRTISNSGQILPKGEM